MTDKAKLIELESAKWKPSALAGGVKALADLFAPDFVSVEYGADTSGGVVRKTVEQLLSGSALPPVKVELSDWRAIHASPEVVVVSYRVTGISFVWKAYATSVWANRDGKWKTVFYQASTAR